MITEWRTAYVSGTAYLGVTESALISTLTYITYTFPQLILTLLRPGDIITQVISTPHITVLSIVGNVGCGR
jgi:hypothetical protein